MEDFVIEHFEKLYITDATCICTINDFQIIFKILSSGKLKNDTIWQVMHDWINEDTVNRLTHFKQFFKKCFNFKHLSQLFVEEKIFLSDIFKLLPLEFQTELREFAKKVLQPPHEQIAKSTAVVFQQTSESHEMENEPSQQLTVVETVSLPTTIETQKAEQLLACIEKVMRNNFHKTLFYNQNDIKNSISRIENRMLDISKTLDYKLEYQKPSFAPYENVLTNNTGDKSTKPWI